MNMAQPNVVREPSMEEILASIRRIIESNEPGSVKPMPSTHFAADRDDDIQLTVDEEFAAADRARAAGQDPRFVAANSQVPVAEPESANRGLSLADVAARVRAASERNAALLSAGRELPQPRELPPAMAARLAEARVEPVVDYPLRNMIADVAQPAAEAQPMAEIEPEIAEMMLREAVAAPQTAAAAQVASPVEAPVFHAPEPHRPVTEVAEAVLEQPEASLASIQPVSSSPLMSEVAGAQVSRSFEELAAIVDGGPRRSLDELAQEMLRPMLQEWLDDNLPTLVERLVREEIERVARGPRR
ncbi:MULTISPECIES: PopZ family protein [unclassified Rhizobium]|uniref:PopZ family protein n=1 Tax=unclassified Rhizobium TaxID=2613769 RepID=UPI0037FF66F1